LDEKYSAPEERNVYRNERLILFSSGGSVTMSENISLLWSSESTASRFYKHLVPTGRKPKASRLTRPN
jgi:hypothetical protein